MRVWIVAAMLALAAAPAFSAGPEPPQQRPGAGKAATLLPALIWNPHYLASGDSLYETLLRADYAAFQTDELAPFTDSLRDYHLFVIGGISEYGEPLLTPQEFAPHAPAVLAFLAGGGGAYWEGAVAISWMGVDSLYAYFPVFTAGPMSWITYLAGNDTTLFGGIDSLGYGGGNSLYLEHPGAPNSFDAIIGPQEPGYHSVAVANSVGPTRTLLTNFSWARLNDTGANTRVDLIHDVMAWLSGATSAAEPEPLPQTFALSQPYPNPFNARVTIEYALPYDAAVSLDVFDIQGRKVVTLSEGEKAAGYHSVTWNAGDSPSGVYFVRLRAGEFVESKKITLLK